MTKLSCARHPDQCNDHTPCSAEQGRVCHPTPLLDWVKRLGQHHLVACGTSNTLCGSPCLGNNYVNSIPKEEWKMCPECERIAKEEGLL